MAPMQVVGFIDSPERGLYRDCAGEAALSAGRHLPSHAYTMLSSNDLYIL